jgi:hypothetical protein
MNLSLRTPFDPSIKPFFSSSFLQHEAGFIGWVDSIHEVVIEFPDPLKMQSKVAAGEALGYELNKSKIKTMAHPRLAGDMPDFVAVNVGGKPDLVEIHRENFDWMQYWKNFNATNEMLMKTNRELFFKLLEKKNQELRDEGLQ